MRVRKYHLVIALLLIAAVTAPYLYAWAQGGEGNVFGGFLFNPVDGNSYLAKMLQGEQGAWKFDLPYTHEDGQGAYLFLFYLLLGHAGRLLGISNLAVFHAARLLAGMVMLWALGFFFQQLFADQGRRRWAFLIAALGSGLGWLGIPWGLFTMDFWVAEAYPFLSAYANPHFPLGLAVLLLILTPGAVVHPLVKAALSLLLAVVQPFAVVVAVIVLLGEALINTLKGAGETTKSWWQRNHVQDLFAAAAGGSPFLLYQYWVINSGELLQVWNQQNQTPSPHLWNTLLSLLPGLALAGLAVKESWGEKKQRRLLVWAAGGLLLAYFPWSLQRRFLTGIYVPLAGLAVIGLDQLKANLKIRKLDFNALALSLMLPTNLIILASGIQAAAAENTQIYYPRSDRAALQWLDDHTEPDELVLANAELGLRIPAISGNKVLYGHPFETVYADERKRMVEAIFSCQISRSRFDELLETYDVDYLLVSDRDQNCDPGPLWVESGKLVFKDGSTRLYEVRR